MKGSSQTNAAILLDFYNGAYGPTIRIDIPSVALLGEIERIFRDLAEGSLVEVMLQNLPFVQISNFASLVLRRDEKLPKSFEVKTMHLKKGKPAQVFEWVKTSEGWKESLEWLQGFHRGPGHQYLTIEGRDDALVEVSFCETSRL